MRKTLRNLKTSAPPERSRRIRVVAIFTVFIGLFFSSKSTNTFYIENIKNLYFKDKLSLLSRLKESALDQKDKEFYKNYLEKYYPKVFVARENFFSKMTSEQIAASLQEVVDIFTYDPWFYISDEKEKCNIGLYWEYILDQLSFFSEYIENAKVDKKSNEVFFTEKTLFEFEYVGCCDYFRSLFSENQESKNSIPLKVFWDEKGIQVHHDFYALCFDYVVKMFNEGILYKDWSQASWYHYELRKVFDKLVGTKHEPEYYDHIKTFKELYDLLKIRLGLDHEESSSDEVEDKFWDEFMQYLEF